MGQVLHGSATTTEAIRRAIQHSQASLRALAKRYGINPKTVAKWKKRSSVADLPTCPREPKSTVLSIGEEAIIVAFRRHTLLPLDDCLYALQAAIPSLTRSPLHRCLQRHGISRLPEVEGDRPEKRKFKAYPIGYFHIDIAEVRTEEGKLYLFVAIDRTSKFAFVELHEKADRPTAARFLEGLIAAVPHRLHTVLTDNGIQFADLPRNRDGWTALSRPPLRPDLPSQRHRASPDKTQPSLDEWPSRADEPNHQGGDRQPLSLRHARPAPNPPGRLRRRLQLQPRLKTLQGLSPYEYICNIWTRTRPIHP
jgi:hypothetical protein